MSLIVMGTVALDNITTSSGVKKGLLGGSATHFCMSARLFAETHIVGVVGEDFPKKHLTFLKDRKINTSSLHQTPGKSFQWEGEYKDEDLNSAITHGTELGVLETFKPQITPEQSKIPNVFLANSDPEVQLHMLKLMSNPKFVGLDSMNLWIDIKKAELKKVMKRVNLFVANDGEARELSGENNLIKAAKTLRKMGPEYVVVKKGEHGVLFYCDKFMFGFSAYPVAKVVDPTGAGDTFAGGIMGYLTKVKTINEKSLRKALIYATTLSSFNVEGFAMAKTAPLTMADVNARMKSLEKFIAIQ